MTIDRIEMINQFNTLPKGSALVVVTNGNGITELVMHDDNQETEVAVYKTAIDILCKEDIVDYRVIPIGDNYIVVNDDIRLLSEVTIHTAG